MVVFPPDFSVKRVFEKSMKTSICHPERSEGSPSLSRILRLFLSKFIVLAFTLPLGFGISAFAGGSREVVVYCALDQPYAEPIFKSFENETGIQIKPLYDSEAVKTAGMVNRLLAEQKRPQCDVFWNNEKLRTVLLAKRGLLEKYEPAAWKERNLPHDEKNSLWTEFSARARVLVRSSRESRILTEVSFAANGEVMDFISEIPWLTMPDLKGKIAIAYPLFGTTSTHFLDWLQERRHHGMDTEKWLQEVIAKKPVICQGNSDVVRRVATGQASFGFTDSDDVFSAQARGELVAIFFPESTERGRGTLIIPNTIALIHGALHREEAAAFIDFVLSEKTELALAHGPSKQIPLGEIRDPAKRDSVPFLIGREPLLKVRRANEEEMVKTYEEDMELLRKAFHR